MYCIIIHLCLYDKEKYTLFVKEYCSIFWGLDGGGGSRIRYSIPNFVLIRDSISEISPL